MAKVRLSPTTLERFLVGPFDSYATDLPDDARIAFLWCDRDLVTGSGQILWLAIESEAFEPVREGQMMPERTVTIRTVP